MSTGASWRFRSRTPQGMVLVRAMETPTKTKRTRTVSSCLRHSALFLAIAVVASSLLVSCGEDPPQDKGSGGVSVDGPVKRFDGKEWLLSDNTLNVTCSSPNRKTLRLIHGADTQAPQEFPAGETKFAITYENGTVSLFHVDLVKTLIASFETGVADLVLSSHIQRTDNYGRKYRINVLGNCDSEPLQLFAVELECP